MNNHIIQEQTKSTELDEELTFEFSKDIKVTTKMNYKKGDVIETLIEKIKLLEKEVSRLGKNVILISSSDSLTELWDNEYDERWNKY